MAAPDIYPVANIGIKRHGEGAPWIVFQSRMAERCDTYSRQPSKATTDPEYDDRMLQVCQRISAGFPLDIRELVIQRQTIRAAHESEGNRPSIDELAANYKIDETKANPAPTRTAIIDDVLTAGTHFKAMQRVLLKRFPGVQIVGVFIARRVLPNDKPEDVFSVVDLDI